MSFLTRYFNPWKYRRQKAAERVAALRARDGDNCARCRRPMRFDLVEGHDQGAAIEPVVPGVIGEALQDFRLCHPRCNPSGVDHTAEVTMRLRKKNEAELFAKARAKRAA
ncbi:hypothetical protein G7076_10105 [Sphingomonas sp. HDW15A]|uniref:hypothetical protein n=1 Tax=Sphingomonas sp. HDW15A TaxID=2714942 RepID=UPI00140E306D|nr:hypothetical protein [Sphingomonas sp. HDW15A]QIK96742.1 hypothetical protein G7076_10105 [Sphingomonas sp. HDW15A]